MTVLCCVDIRLHLLFHLTLPKLSLYVHTRTQFCKITVDYKVVGSEFDVIYKFKPWHNVLFDYLNISCEVDGFRGERA